MGWLDEIRERDAAKAQTRADASGAQSDRYYDRQRQRAAEGDTYAANRVARKEARDERQRLREARDNAKPQAAGDDQKAAEERAHRKDEAKKRKVGDAETDLRGNTVKKGKGDDGELAALKSQLAAAQSAIDALKQRLDSATASGSCTGSDITITLTI